MKDSERSGDNDDGNMTIDSDSDELRPHSPIINKAAKPETAPRAQTDDEHPNCHGDCQACRQGSPRRPAISTNIRVHTVNEPKY